MRTRRFPHLADNNCNKQSSCLLHGGKMESLHWENPAEVGVNLEFGNHSTKWTMGIFPYDDWKTIAVVAGSMAVTALVTHKFVPKRPKLLLANTDSLSSYQFGPYLIPSNHVFLRTSLSYAFVNRKPVVKGHVLVCPLRSVKRLLDMTEPEIADVFLAAQLVQRKLEEYHGVNAMTVTIQDGPLAGQTVPHVHIHLLPRREGDFKENQIYQVLASHDKGEAGRTGFRDPEDMAAEASEYRKLLCESE